MGLCIARGQVVGAVDEALQGWPTESLAVQPVSGGLINQTYRLDDDGGPVGVLQRLNTDIFCAEVHEDIEAITQRLRAQGVPTPRLVRTRAGTLWHRTAEGGIWRWLSWEGDQTVDRVQSSAMAEDAGALVGTFHRALEGFEWRFRSQRPGAHDTPGHLAALISAIDDHSGHRLYDAVASLADQITAGWAAWSGPLELPPRIVHGDLKISNLRLLRGHAHCLVDLDTLAWGSLDIELGDAMRSWCNSGSEDQASAIFSVEIFEAAMRGYARTGAATEDEWAGVVPGVERVCWELAARFARDALCEDYFGFNPRYGGHGEHSLLRARGQASLAASVASQRGQAEALMQRLRRKG